MKNSFAKKIYRNKYERDLSYDQFMSYLTKGLSLLRTSKPNNLSDNDIKAMNIAMEYNLELVIRQSSANEFYD
jgi:hypothetical protein